MLASGFIRHDGVGVEQQERAIRLSSSSRARACVTACPKASQRRALGRSVSSREETNLRVGIVMARAREGNNAYESSSFCRYEGGPQMSRRSAWALGTLLLCAVVGCQPPPPPPPPRPTSSYTITGTISVTSDCNRPTSPMPVTIKMNLSDARGDNKLSGSANVTLIGTPPAPLTGTYTIIVNWPGFLPVAGGWTDFSIVAPNGDPACKPIGCPVAGRTCSNIAQWHRTAAALAPPGKTTEDFSILCACGS